MRENPVDVVSLRECPLETEHPFVRDEVILHDFDTPSLVENPLLTLLPPDELPAVCDTCELPLLTERVTPSD